MQIKKLQTLLNKFLNDSGTSKNALAKKLGISQSQVSYLSNGKLKRWTKNTKKIADFIQEYYKDNYEIPVEIEKILKDILSKNQGAKKQILSILNSINEIQNKGKNEWK